MTPETPALAAIRQRLIELLEDDEILIGYKVEAEARATLAKYRPSRSQYDVFQFILKLLKDGFPMTEIELIDPDYRPGRGYVMNYPYGYDVYIKVRIKEVGFRELVHILSFHPNR